MDCISSFLGTVLVECGRQLCGPVYFSMKNHFQFHSNIDTLDNCIRSLSDMKIRTKEEIELAEVNGLVRTPQASMWLGKVEEIEISVSSIQAEVTANTPNLLGCLNCSMRYRLSRKVAKKLKESKQILNEGNPHPLVMVDSRLKAVEQLPGPSIMDQNTASLNLAKILEFMKNDKLGTIGVVGMGGVGKTTLIRNLNNKLESMNLAQPFGIVIWVTVSQDLHLKRVQNRIAERLNLVWERKGIEGKAIQLFNRLKKVKRFILILDDVWERIDLDRIGIPRPKVHLGCKIILTTRSVDVCREMATDTVFSVLPLCDEEARRLFSQSAGDVVNSKQLKPFAENLTKECAGLPLAILTVGRAMSGKTKVELWKNALRALQRSNPVPYIKGIEKEVFLPLKLSYDSLEGKNIRPCFLYCSLYPEDFSIEINELLQCWLAEGLLDDQEDHEEVYNMGIAMIENLKDSCLLECGEHRGTVRMHDVVRDVAIWIASSTEDGHKSLIRSGFDLRQITGIETWGSFKRVSYMSNRIEMLPDCAEKCFQVSTLLLQDNPFITNVPYGFLRGFLALRVLNLSDTDIKSLPPLEYLGELRALFARNCSSLKDFSALRGLQKLQVLDISGNDRYMSAQEEWLMLKEVSLLKHLLEFYVDLFHVPNIENPAWLKRLRRFCICIGSTDQRYHSSTPHNERAIYVCHTKCSSKAITVMWSNASALVIDDCKNIMEMWTGANIGGLDFLKSLTVKCCSWTGSMGENDDTRHHKQVLLSSLEFLHLSHVRELCSISKLINQFGTNIRIIKIKWCHGLEQLFPLDLLHKLKSLEEIYVEDCHSLVEIVMDGTAPANAFPNLRIMELKKLPSLNSICQQVMVWPCLKRIEVISCPNLKELPVSSQHKRRKVLVRK